MEQPTRSPMSSTDTTPKVPLLKHLNTFFLSRNGRRRTSHAPSSQPAAGTGDFGDMTPASLINYRIAGVPHRPSLNNANMTLLHDRNNYSNLPVRMKMVKNSYVADEQKLRTLNLKKFSSLSIRQLTSEDKTPLPESHILRAKTILTSKTVTTAQDQKPAIYREIEKSKTEAAPSRPQTNPNKQRPPSDSADDHTRLTMSLHRLIKGYTDHNKSPYSVSLVNDNSASQTNYGTAELFDYTTRCTSYSRLQ